MKLRNLRNLLSEDYGIPNDPPTSSPGSRPGGNEWWGPGYYPAGTDDAGRPLWQFYDPDLSTPIGDPMKVPNDIDPNDMPWHYPPPYPDGTLPLDNPTTPPGFYDAPEGYRWVPTEDGRWQLVDGYGQPICPSIDPMNPPTQFPGSPWDGWDWDQFPNGPDLPDLPGDGPGDGGSPDTKPPDPSDVDTRDVDTRPRPNWWDGPFSPGKNPHYPTPGERGVRGGR